jgi:hypothetical protein
MARYILVGGSEIAHSHDGGVALGAAIAAGRAGLKVLSVNFAIGREFWERKFVERTTFLRQILGQNVQVELAMPRAFPNQVAWADVVYIHGGDNTLLACYLNQYKDLAAMFAQKTVVGSSAGGQYLSVCSWSSDWRGVIPGRGILHVKTLPHYDSLVTSDDPRGPIDWQAARHELETYGAPDIPVYCLREGQFIEVTG